MVSLKKSHPRSWPSPGSQSTVLFPWAVTEVSILTHSHSSERKHFITCLLAGKVRLTWAASLLEFSIKLFTQAGNKPTDLCRKSAGTRWHLFYCEQFHFSRDPSSFKCDPLEVRSLPRWHLLGPCGLLLGARKVPHQMFLHQGPQAQCSSQSW